MRHNDSAVELYAAEVARLNEQLQTLKAAAIKVCDRWDSPDWKEPIHTGDLIHKLRTEAEKVK